MLFIARRVAEVLGMVHQLKNTRLRKKQLYDDYPTHTRPLDRARTSDALLVHGLTSLLPPVHLVAFELFHV